MLKGRLLLTGGSGMLGAAIRANLEESHRCDVFAPTRAELDLSNASDVERYVLNTAPDYVVHLGAAVFGLGGNLKWQLNTLEKNTVLNHNVLSASARANVRKVFFAGTVASYPFPYASLPLTEDQLFGGLPHYGEFGYAMAKLHAFPYLRIMHAEQGIPYTYALFTNLYGPNDRFNVESGHVVPSLIKKIRDAHVENTSFRVWGDGEARRDFMHVTDAARAALLALEVHNGTINIATGVSSSIKDVVTALCTASNFSGAIVYEAHRPVGIPERSVSNRLLHDIGFNPHFDLVSGIADAYQWYLDHANTLRT